MAIVYTTVSAQLNYFSCLEDDLLETSRWIEFSKDNELVYSIELARLLMTAAAEVDVVAKALCKAIDARAKAEKIDEYFKLLKKNSPAIFDVEVHMPRFKMTFKPWEDWASGKPPKWWTACNKVKHERDTKFNQANLGNVLNAVAGLLVLLVLLHSKTSLQFPLKPALFTMNKFVTQHSQPWQIILGDDVHFPWNQ